MLSFQVKDDGAQVARQFARRARVFTYAVSLGKQRSLVFYLPTEDLLRSSFTLTGPARESYRAFAGDGIFRVSIGLEEPEDLCRDLDRVLAP
jgi:cystathionine gamma-synthase/methionine-gamma-lyase